MTATVSDFRTRFPEYSDSSLFPDPRIQLFLDDAESDMDVSKWDDLFDRGQLYLAAHYLVVGTGTAQSSTAGGQSKGNVTGKSVGDVSVSYGVSNATMSDPTLYSTTTYGQQYLDLVRRLGCQMISVGGTITGLEGVVGNG